MKENKPAIIFIPGLWMTGLEFFYLRFKFRQQGYRVYTFHYSSVFTTPENNAKRLARVMNKIDEPVLHIVAHSLGGIVLSHLCQQAQLKKPGKMVLLTSPVNGSAVARRMARYRILKALLGKAIVNGLINAPGWQCSRSTCVIAGSRQFGLGQYFAPHAMEAVNDGTVNLSETEINTAKESHLVHHTHFSLLWSKSVFGLIRDFLAQPG